MDTTHQFLKKAPSVGLSHRVKTPPSSSNSVSFGASLNLTSTPTERSGTQRKALSPISSFLNLPLMRKNARGDKFSASRVLTSEQCLAMIEEKERKKGEEEEAKERRKTVREEKRRSREAEKQKKYRGKTKKGSGKRRKQT